ncbi:hypothetical protein QPK87_09005 [Kamptonema cortianum]|nr:hypothetical protein [Kamptonema cortianum]MDL5046210.1 hypothetical protein [Oscillatoria amoena NRMC-F 0135]
MNDETAPRPAQTSHGEGSPGGGLGGAAPLQTRACFLENWSWPSITQLNRGLCEGKSAQFGLNPETGEEIGGLWEKMRGNPVSLEETYDFLRMCHRKAPFLFFNGNTFAAIGRKLTVLLMGDLPAQKRDLVASAVAHYVSGVLDKDSMAATFVSLGRKHTFKPGDRVKTLKGSLRGRVVEIASSGHVVWNDGFGNITASADSLLPDESI